jgi:hypothetical protein
MAGWRVGGGIQGGSFFISWVGSAMQVVGCRTYFFNCGKPFFASRNGMAGNEKASLEWNCNGVPW